MFRVPRPLRATKRPPLSGLCGRFLLVVWVVVAGCGGVRVLVENCTVDASIFVVKLLRAHGGCLGTRSR